MENEETATVLSKALAWIDATQPLIEALVIAHPDPVKLRDTWQQRLPQQVEDGMRTPPFGVALYREKLLQTLGDISSWLDERAASHTGKDPRSPGR